MAVTIYKRGQGYTTRVMTAIFVGLVVLLGAYWMWEEFAGATWFDLPSIYISAGVATLFAAVAAGLSYWLIAVKHRTVDFLIATDSEMKKVNWSTRREVIGSTTVVIGLSLIVALYCFGFDRVFFLIFAWLGVLETGA
ncbi:MAG: preprotein translocase subunit SecE [Planctomycetota bacterium]|jgi:preprotein translocase SecE subunit|nr:preprotein translocase subunit SecE [Planctomycetota bacterium]